MAINQVIAGKNRITEFPNRWSLTNVGGNNYDVEQVTGEITEVGTPYSKAILDKIDNVLSYLKPSIVKTPSESGFIIQPLGVGNLLATSVDQSWTASGNNVGSTISGSLTPFTLNGVTYTPTYSYITSLANGFKAYGNTSVMSSGYHPFYDNVSSSNRYTSAYFLQNEQRTENSSGSNYHYFIWVGRSSYDRRLDKIYDMKIPCIPTFKYLMNASNYSYIYMYKIFGSNNNQDWTELTSISNNVSTTYTPNDEYRYFMFSIYFNGSSSNDTSLSISHNYISEVNVKVPKYDYNYILDNNTSFTNNQRVLIQIPQETDLTELALNKINNIDCDTILQPSTKYELIYKEDTDKFEPGGGPILYDITLTESVTRVDLNGISKKLEFNKLYSISIDGKASDGITVILGTNTYGILAFAYPDNVYKEIREVTFFVSGYQIKNNIETLSLFVNTGNSNSQSTNLLIAGENYEYLDFTHALNAGTRIIIKEVA